MPIGPFRPRRFTSFSSQCQTVLLVRNGGFAYRPFRLLWHGREIGFALARLILIDQLDSKGV